MLALLVAIARAEATVGSSTLSTETAASDAPAGAAATTSDEPVAPKPKKKGKKKAEKDAADASVVPAATTSEGMSAKVDFNAKGVSPEEAERNRRKKILYDAAAYGDAGADTLGHVVRQQRPALPNLTRWGLGRLVDGVDDVERPAASWGRLTERAAGKDSTTGHWALAGLVLDEPFPTYTDGFPDDVIDRFCRAAGVEGVLGNRPASGTAIIAEMGEEHLRTGRPLALGIGQHAQIGDPVRLQIRFDFDHPSGEMRVLDQGLAPAPGLAGLGLQLLQCMGGFPPQ